MYCDNCGKKIDKSKPYLTAHWEKVEYRPRTTCNYHPECYDEEAIRCLTE